MGSRKRGRKKPYPHNGDVREAIAEALSKVLKPDDLPMKVREILEERGFYTGLLTDKRIWRIYEELARSGKIFDTLGVVPDLSERESEEQW